LSKNPIEYLKEKWSKYKRVITISRKPDKDEFMRAAKICALGITLIGMIGFLIYAVEVILLK